MNTVNPADVDEADEADEAGLNTTFILFQILL